MNFFALSISPVTLEFKNQLSNTYQKTIDYCVLKELRQMSLVKMLKTLRSIKTPKILLIVEDANSLALLPILKIMASFTRAKHIEVVNPNREAQVYKKKEGIKLTFSLITATFRAFMSFLFSYIELLKLKTAELVTVKNNHSKKAIHINNNLWFGVKAGGSVAHISGVVNALNNTEFNTFYASVSAENPLINPCVKFLPITSPQVWGIPVELNYYYFNKYAFKQLAKQIEAIQPQFIYSRLSLINYTSVKLSRQYQVPLIIEYNGSEVWVSKNWGKTTKFPKCAQLAEDICLKHAHLIVTISEVLYDELKNRGVDENKIVYYPNCVDPEIFNPNQFTLKDKQNLRSKYGISADTQLLTFIGTFGKWHGIEFLANTITQLIDERKEWVDKHKIKFMLVGDGTEMQLVKSTLSPAAYQDYVILTGIIPQKEAPLYLASSDILLSPHVPNADGSKFFGSPTKLFEYMAMEKGIIAADLEQIGKILQHSLRVENLPHIEPNNEHTELAVLYQPSNNEQLISAIEFLIENPRWVKKIGENARKEVIKNYTWDKHVNVILQKFKERIQ